MKGSWEGIVRNLFITCIGDRFCLTITFNAQDSSALENAV